MKIKLIAMGKNMPQWVDIAFKEYSKRLPPSLKLELIEIPLLRRNKQADNKSIISKEGEKMLNAIAIDDLIIALEVTGENWDTLMVANKLQQWHDTPQNVALLIGGPEGLAPKCQQQAHLQWSLSHLTLPHPLVRVLIAEQIYRAWSINTGHPYHR